LSIKIGLLLKNWEIERRNFSQWLFWEIGGFENEKWSKLRPKRPSNSNAANDTLQQIDQSPIDKTKLFK
jgi:hypothetical protein